MPYTGHVTIGGAICIEALTLSGGPGQWQPSYCVESIMNVSAGRKRNPARTCPNGAEDACIHTPPPGRQLGSPHMQRAHRPPP